jgi:hypothetical protein
MANTVELELFQPLTVAGVTHTILVVHEAAWTGRCLRLASQWAASVGCEQQELMSLASLLEAAGIPAAFIDTMHMFDVNALAQVAGEAGFFTRPATPPSGSAVSSPEVSAWPTVSDCP